MNINEEQEIKKEFQLERVILFSDAVFAIIITIMVIDLKLPENLHHATAAQVRDAFMELLPKFFAYMVSFFLVGNFWIRHLRIFSFLKDYDTRLIVLNLAFLFFISLFPFAVSFISGGSHIMEYTWGIFTYVGIIFLIITAQTFLVHYLIANRERLCFSTEKMDAVLKWKVQRLNYVFVPAVFILMFIMVIFEITPKTLIYLMAIYGFLIGKLGKKFYPENQRTPFLKLVYSRVRRKKSKV